MRLGDLTLVTTREGSRVGTRGEMPAPCSRPSGLFLASRPHPGRQPGGHQKGSRVGTRKPPPGSRYHPASRSSCSHPAPGRYFFSRPPGKAAGWAPEGICISSPPGKAAGWEPEGICRLLALARPACSLHLAPTREGSRVGTREGMRRLGGHQKGSWVGTRNEKLHIPVRIIQIPCGRGRIAG